MPANEKVFPGAEFVPPAARTWNELIDAKDRVLRGVKPVDPPIPTDVVKVQVTTSLPRGSVVELGDRIITDLDPRALIYDWVPSGPNPENYWAITRQQIAANEIGEAQVAGVCIARVDVLDVAHRFARVVAGSNVMESAGSGPCRLVQLAEEEGEQELVVCIRFEPHVEVVEIISSTKVGAYYPGRIMAWNPSTEAFTAGEDVWVKDANE